MKNIKEGTLILIGLVITQVYLFDLGDFLIPTVNVIAVIAPLLPVLAGIDASMYFGKNNKQTKIMMLLTIGTGLLWLGDIMWSFVYGEAVVSAADVIYLSAYPVLAVAILLGMKVIEPDIWKDKKLLLRWVVIGVIVSAIYLKLIPLGWDSEVTFLENLLTSGYVVADLMLILMIAALVLQVINGTYSQGWIIIGFGLLLYAIGDMLYSAYYDIYDDGSLIDLAWYWGNILMAIGIVRYKESARKIMQLALRKKS